MRRSRARRIGVDDGADQRCGRGAQPRSATPPARRGELDPAGQAVELGPYRVHRGDHVATRQNARQLVTDRHFMVKNRDRWAVGAIHRDGSLTVAGKTGTVKLPADYVHEHVELVYAETSHANQGRTVDRSFLYLDGPPAPTASTFR